MKTEINYCDECIEFEGCEGCFRCKYESDEECKGCQYDITNCKWYK